MENTGTNTDDSVETSKEFIDNEWMVISYFSSALVFNQISCPDTIL